MNARIRERKGNYYIEIQRWDDGDRKVETISVRKRLKLKRPATDLEARKLLTEINYQEDRGLSVRDSKITLEKYLEEWFELHRHSLKPKTVESYQGLIKNYINPNLGTTRLQDLTAGQLKALYKRLLASGSCKGTPLSNRTVKYVHVILKSALEVAVDEGILVKNVLRQVTPPKVSKPAIRYWEWADAERFLKETRGDRYHIYYCIALSTGMCRAEILGLRWKDINFERSTLSINQTYVDVGGGLMQPSAKTAARMRTLDLGPGLIQRLKEHQEVQKEEIAELGLEDTGLVVSTTTGRPLAPNSLTQAMGRAIKTRNMPPLSSHGLRHTYATRLLELGVHPKVVSERLGHSSIQITLDTYSHALPRLQKDAALVTEGLFTAGTEKPLAACSV